MTEVPSQFVTLDSAIQMGMFLAGEKDNPSSYVKFKYAALQLVNELQWDALRNFKRVFLGVDNSTKTAKLPLDYVQWVRVGVIDQGNEVQDLAYNPNIAFAVSSENCNEVSKHCDCGCTDEVCFALSNAETTFEDIVINGTTYQKTTTVCTTSDNKLVKRICVPVVTNVRQQCTAEYNLSTFVALSSPQKNAATWVVVIDSVSTDLGLISSLETLVESLNGLGQGDWEENSPNITAVGSFVYGNIYLSVSGVLIATVTPEQSCESLTPEVTTQCYDEFVCDVEVEDCGCIIPTQTVVNTLASMGILENEFMQRYIQALDWLQTFKQPASYFGYFNIDIYSGIMQLDNTYPYNAVYMEYYSANEVDSGDYLIPVFAKDAIAWGCKWMYSETRSNVSDRSKDRNNKMWLNKKRLLRERFQPIHLEQLMQIIRMPVRP